MPEIPDSLQTVFSATVEQRGDSFHIEVPSSEVEAGALENGQTYRVTLLKQNTSRQSASPGELQDQAHSEMLDPSSDHEGPTGYSTAPDPPVDEGDVVNVEIEGVGDEGDGLAKLDGFAVFVPSGEPGDHLIVKIESVNRTVAHARALKGRHPSGE